MRCFDTSSAFLIVNCIFNLPFSSPFFAESNQTIDDGQFGIHSKLDKMSLLITTCSLLLCINAQRIGHI